MKILDIILKKRDGFELTREELNFIAFGAARGYIPDYQLSAWLMAVYFNGLNSKETAFFTRAMAFSGKRLNLDSIKGYKIDKHSTGGVGDGISLALAPIVASCGIIVPMMSGRGLGHTGGTLDKLESIRGFKVRLTPSHILRQLNAIKVCMFGQTEKLAPADKKLYALRDVTGTVESIPLIVASILSKKYAEGIDGLVMDVKFGSGAFMREYSRSRELALALKNTAKMLGINAVAVLSDMNNPLGRAIGNGIEMEQSIRILHGEKISYDFEYLLYLLCGYMIFMGKKARTPEEGIEKAIFAVKSGKALNTLRALIKWQGGDVRVVDNPHAFLPRGKFVYQIKAPSEGYIISIEARTAGMAGVSLGIGRLKADDNVDWMSGIWLNKKTGDYVRKNEIIATLYCSDAKKLMEAKDKFLDSLKVSRFKPKKIRLVREIIS